MGVSRSFGDAPKASILFELSQDIYFCILLMLLHLLPNEIRAEYHVPKS